MTEEQRAIQQAKYAQVMADRVKYALTQAERDAALRVVQTVFATGNTPKPTDLNYLECVVTWACNGIDFYRDERATGNKSYIVVDGSAPIRTSETS